MEKPICTVLLISYNHVKYIKKCIDSVLSQKTEYKYIIKIFDDCSTDGTKEIIESYAKKYPEIIFPYINDKNTGAQENIWRAYKSVDTKYCILTETDDYWCADDKLQLQIDALEQHPECSFCSTNNFVIVLDDKYLSFKNNRLEIEQDIYDREVITYDYIEDIPTGFLTHISTRLLRSDTMGLDSIKNKETFLFDASQYFYLLTKGDMYWVNKTCSVYVKTGKGVWSSSDAKRRMSMYLSAMAQLNEDTDGELWRKIIQQISLVGNFWLKLDKPENMFKEILRFVLPPIFITIYVNIKKVIVKKMRCKYVKQD